MDARITCREHSPCAALLCPPARSAPHCLRLVGCGGRPVGRLYRRVRGFLSFRLPLLLGFILVLFPLWCFSLIKGAVLRHTFSFMVRRGLVRAFFINLLRSRVRVYCMAMLQIFINHWLSQCLSYCWRVDRLVFDIL